MLSCCAGRTNSGLCPFCFSACLQGVQVPPFQSAVQDWTGKLDTGLSQLSRVKNRRSPLAMVTCVGYADWLLIDYKLRTFYPDLPTTNGFNVFFSFFSPANWLLSLAPFGCCHPRVLTESIVVSIFPFGRSLAKVVSFRLILTWFAADEVAAPRCGLVASSSTFSDAIACSCVAFSSTLPGTGSFIMLLRNVSMVICQLWIKFLQQILTGSVFFVSFSFLLYSLSLRWRWRRRRRYTNSVCCVCDADSVL